MLINRKEGIHKDGPSLPEDIQRELDDKMEKQSKLDKEEEANKLKLAELK